MTETAKIAAIGKLIGKSDEIKLSAGTQATKRLGHSIRERWIGPHLPAAKEWRPEPPFVAGRDEAAAQMSLPIAEAVSAMRLEKPHSLSYQDMTRTKLPSITLVWSSAKVEDAGLWLRSQETSLSSV